METADKPNIDDADIASRRANDEPPPEPEALDDEALAQMLAEIAASDAAKAVLEEQERAARLSELEQRYPEEVRRKAREIAIGRQADPDAPLSTMEGDFEWGWVAYAEQAAKDGGGA